MMVSKPEESRKMFAQISPETVNLIAETLGIPSGTGLDPKVTRALAEDASYRVREVVSVASQILKHSKRRRLTVNDVNRAFETYDADPVLGHGDGSNAQGYSVMVDVGKGGNASVLAGQDQNLLYVPQERLIDLRPFALGQSPPVMASEPGIQASWLAVEGNYYPEGEDQKAVDFPKQSNITPTLAKYYQAVTTIILGDSQELFRMIIADVRTNPKIGTLLPWLVCFVRNGMQRHCENKTLMFRLLSLLQAVFSNTTLNLSPKPYLSHLVTALLSSLIVDRPGPPQQQQQLKLHSNTIINVDHVQQASQILRQVLDRWATPVNQLRTQTHSALRVYLKDKNISHSSHYGALSAMIALGPRVLDECLVPQLETYIVRVTEQMQQARNAANAANVVRRTADLKVAAAKIQVLNLMWGTLAMASRSLLTYHGHLAGQGVDEAVSRHAAALYALVCEHFGDTLANCQSTRHHRRKATVDLPHGRLRIRPLRNRKQGSSASSSQVASRPHSSHMFSADPDLNVPMDIFDEDDEDDGPGNTQEENPSEAVGASVKANFEVSSKQVRSCWHAKRKHKAQLTSGHGVHYPCITSPLWSTQQNVRFQGPERLNRHRPRKALIGHTYTYQQSPTPSPHFVAGRMGQVGDKAARTLKSAVLNSCCLDTVL